MPRTVNGTGHTGHLLISTQRPAVGVALLFRRRGARFHVVAPLEDLGVDVLLEALRADHEPERINR